MGGNQVRLPQNLVYKYQNNIAETAAYLKRFKLKVEVIENAIADYGLPQWIVKKA